MEQEKALLLLEKQCPTIATLLGEYASVPAKDSATYNTEQKNGKGRWFGHI
jgi:hypothetical protein